MSNNNFQFLSFNVYAAKKRASFFDFKSAILSPAINDINTIVDVIALSSECGIYGVATAKPNINESDCEEMV